MQKDHIISYGLGDWFDIGPDVPGNSQLTSNGVTATATYYYNAVIMQKIARLLGISEDVEVYENWQPALRFPLIVHFLILYRISMIAIVRLLMQLFYSWI